MFYVIEKLRQVSKMTTTNDESRADYPRYYIKYPFPEHLICTNCHPVPKSYRRHADLNKHIKKDHKLQLGFTCIGCDEQFLTIKMCKSHQSRTGHSDEVNTDGNNYQPPSSTVQTETNTVQRVTRSRVRDIQQQTTPTPTISSNISILVEVEVSETPSSPIVSPARTPPAITRTAVSNIVINNNRTPILTDFQLAAMTALDNCHTFEQVEIFSDKFVLDIQSKLPQRRTYNGNRRNTIHFEPVEEATNLQRLFRSNKKKAMKKVLDESSAQCKIPKVRLEEYFTNTFADSGYLFTSIPDIVPDIPAPAVQDNPLERPFSREEIWRKLKYSKNAAPGPDRITNKILKETDPGAHLLTVLFNKLKLFKRTPASWKKSVTILIHKKNDPDDPANWRPIALSTNISKLYSACVAQRLTSWCSTNKRISKPQKGFMPYEGCMEHNFIVQSIIEDTRRSRKNCCLAWLDLTNAFGSIPHKYIFKALNSLGLSDTAIIEELYSGGTTHIKCGSGETKSININAGVKQGCPLSPIIFNLAIEPMLRALLKAESGYTIHNQSFKVLAYADDLVLTADSIDGLQKLLDIASKVACWSGLTFNASKCATLHIDGRQRSSLPSEFVVQNGVPPVLQDGDAYTHLGIPTGMKVSNSPDTRGIVNDINKIDKSLLAPWQKTEAINVFILPQLDFLLKTAIVQKTPLTKLDKIIKRTVKSWMNLPQRASPELLYLHHKDGGANILPLNAFSDICLIVHAYKLLNSKDKSVSSLSNNILEEVVLKKLNRSPTVDDLAQYLTGSLSGDFRRDGGDISSIWSRARLACRRIAQVVNVKWINDNNTLKVTIGTKTSFPRSLERQLKTALRTYYLKQILAKPDQGKVLEVSSKWSNSNHFLRAGNFIRFADWRFIHRARLDVVPLNGNRRFGTGDKRCRRCGYSNETLPHVLNHCKPHQRAATLRHDNVQKRFVAAIPSTLGTIQTNRTVTGSNSNLRPDIVISNNTTKQITIIDVTVPFENRYESFREARREKVRKYRQLADELRAKGFTVYLDALIVGTLGSWDPANEQVLRHCKINRKYAGLMRKLMISDTIRWSRDIYVEHVSGQQQYVI